MKKIYKNITEAPASGKKSWAGGAFTIAFVYSNKGNFIVKGFLNEVEAHLASLKNRGYKYFVNYTLYGSIHEIELNGVSLRLRRKLTPEQLEEIKKSLPDVNASTLNIKRTPAYRNFWEFYKTGVTITAPHRSYKFDVDKRRFVHSREWNTWEISWLGIDGVEKKFLRRLPNKWNSFFEEISSVV